MAIACLFGRHTIVSRGVRNNVYEFGRCERCRCDMLRAGEAWKRVPKGFKVVWRPKTELVDQNAGQAAVSKEVDLKGVTVLGERRYGSQRFALVVLNANDERSYAGTADRLNAPGAVAAEMERHLACIRAPVQEQKQQNRRLSDFLSAPIVLER
jgi:hypothetical protein